MLFFSIVLHYLKQLTSHLKNTQTKTRHRAHWRDVPVGHYLQV